MTATGMGLSGPETARHATKPADPMVCINGGI